MAAMFIQLAMLTNDPIASLLETDEEHCLSTLFTLCGDVPKGSSELFVSLTACEVVPVEVGNLS